MFASLQCLPAHVIVEGIGCINNDKLNFIIAQKFILGPDNLCFGVAGCRKGFASLKYGKYLKPGMHLQQGCMEYLSGHTIGCKPDTCFFHIVNFENEKYN